MTHERREDRSAPTSDRRHDNRRHDARRTEGRSGPDRRQRDRRRLQRGVAGLMIASAGLGTGAMRTMDRHDAAVGGDETATTRTYTPGGLIAKGEAAPEEASSTGLPLPVYLNRAVENAVEGFSGNGRVGFASALERGAPHLDDIRKVFIEEGVPPDLAYVALVESEFKPHAQSGAQARGVWQFMPQTGKSLGLQQDFWVDERSDTEKSTRAAAQYLKYLHGRFGDWNLALAAYNAGEGNVTKAMKRAGTNDFWKLAERGALPRETRNYVPRIHAAILMAREPAKYGIEVKPAVATQAPEAVEMPEATDLRAVASCTGADLDEIMDLNPALKRRATPLNRTMTIRLPAGKGSEAQKCVLDLPAAERMAVQKHTVQAGQSIGTLARKYNTRASDIASMNNLKNPKKIAKGTELLIPKAGLLAD
jgi:membrane-bound lytic murein transglycosylase D